MNTIMVDYDLMYPGQKYGRIIAYLNGHASKSNPLKSTWLIHTNKTATQVRNDLLGIIDNNDKLLVTDVSHDEMAWYGLPNSDSQWILNSDRPLARR